MNQPADAATPIRWDQRLAALRSATFVELYPAQEAALNAYAAEHLATRNIAIELPTGAGKTLIASLILEYWMSQGKRTVVLCGTKNLARQFKKETDALNLPTVLFEGAKNTWKATDKFRYHRAQAVAVLNYWGYINQAPGIDPADVVVFDDAHLAEHAAHSLFSIDISRTKNPELYNQLVADLAKAYPHYSSIVDYELKAHTPFSPVELINFTDWLEFIPRCETVLNESIYTKKDGPLFFNWARNKRSLASSLCLVSSNSISIRPGCYPLISQAHISKPHQRIFLSATIGTADDLARRVGVPEVANLPIQGKFRFAVPGKRLMILPESDSREAEITSSATDLAIRLRRSAWLCASSAEADQWAAHLQAALTARGITDQPIFIAEGEAEEIDRFVDSKFGHLFTAARYDGMDFEGDICRLVIMPSLPQACGPYERFISENLADASFMYSRVLQRMKQALGRATRNDHDWAVYMFLKNSLTNYLTSEEGFTYLPSNVQEEIAFGVDVSAKTADERAKVVNGFLRGKLAEIGFPQREVKFPTDEESSRSNVADSEVEFWRDIFVGLDFNHAASSAESAATALEASGEPGYALFWRYLKSQSLYLRYKTDNDPAGLAHAKNELIRILDERRQSAWFSRLNRLRHNINLETVHDDAAEHEHDVIISAWNQLLNSELRNPKAHEVWLQTVRKGLADANHSNFASALRRLFNLLGWEAEVRDKIEGATDVIASVAIGSEHYLLVVEVKPEMDPEKPIPLRYISQALAQLRTYENDPAFKPYKKAGIIVSRSATIDDTAVVPAKSLAFVLQSSFVALAERAIPAFQRYASIRYKRGFLPKRSECIEALTMAPAVLGPYTAAQVKGRALTDDEVMAFSGPPNSCR